MTAPPEPGSIRAIEVIVSCRLVKRTPDHRNTLIFKQLKITGNLLYILHYEVVLPCTELQGLPDIEGCLVTIECVAVEIVVIDAIVPISFAVRNIPVPHVVYKATGGPLLLRS